MLDAAKVPADVRDQIVAQIVSSNVEAHHYSRTFNVILVDGVSRRVIVKNEDPKDFEVEVRVGSDGGVTLNSN